MRKYNKKQIIFDKIGENQKYKKNNLQGCTTAVQLLKSQK